MREGRLERRLAGALVAASDALRAAADAVAEYSEERERLDNDNMRHRERYERRDSERTFQSRAWGAGSGSDPEDGPEQTGAALHPPLPPYPPFPPYPPYPPMPPIVIAGGCSCGHGAGWGPAPWHGLNAGWPPLPPGPGPLVPQAHAGASSAAMRFETAPSSFVPPSAAALPAGGVSFDVASPAPAEPSGSGP